MMFGTAGILCNFYAVDHLVLADASMLNKMSPFFAVLFSCLILKEKVTVPQGVIVAGAFIGSMFVVKPTFSNMDLIPSIIGLCGGIGAGAAYTMVRKLGENGEKGPFIVFFFSVIYDIAGIADAGFRNLALIEHFVQRNFHSLYPVEGVKNFPTVFFIIKPINSTQR